jgi:hypothetical protein
MVRKLTTEKRAPLAALNTANIKAKGARFAQDLGPAIRECEKIHGEGLNDRAADTFDPLFVIARLAGKEWEEKLHAAALALAPIAQSRNSGTELLQDIYAMFVLMDETKMFTRLLFFIYRSFRMPELCVSSRSKAVSSRRVRTLQDLAAIRTVHGAITAQTPENSILSSITMLPLPGRVEKRGLHRVKGRRRLHVVSER